MEHFAKHLTPKERKLVARTLRKAFPVPSVLDPFGVIEEMNHLSAYVDMRMEKLDPALKQAAEQQFFLALAVYVEKVLRKQGAPVRAQLEQMISDLSENIEQEKVPEPERQDT